MKKNISNKLTVLKEGFKKVGNKILKKKNGEVNTVAVLVIIAVFLLVTYPIYKNLINDFMTSVQTWFKTTTDNIFK